MRRPQRLRICVSFKVVPFYAHVFDVGYSQSPCSISELDTVNIGFKRGDSFTSQRLTVSALSVSSKNTLLLTVLFTRVTRT